MNTAAHPSAGIRPRLEHIDGLRALAAIYVVIHHILLYAYDDLPGGAVRRVSDLFLFGHYAVDVFIVISGFCLMLPVLRHRGEISGGMFRFFAKRARRILPPYFAVVILSLILIWLFIGTPTGSQWNSSLPVTRDGIFSHLFLVQDIFSNTSHRINYCLWSISVEWRIYFLFPFMVFCWNRYGALKTVLAVNLISFLLLIPLEYTYFDTSAGGVCLHYYGLFAFGMLAAGFAYPPDLRFQELRERLPWPILGIAAAALAFIANKGYVNQVRLPWQIQDLFVGMATLCLLVAVTPGRDADRWGWVRRTLAWGPFDFVGTFSYSLYLIHAPLLEILWVYFIHPLHWSPLASLLLFSTVGLLAVIACAYLFFLLCERPFMGSIPRRPDGPIPAPVMAQ
jgi:peptidoglycan/LPS O-acetylase OafA/YrhL